MANPYYQRQVHSRSRGLLDELDTKALFISTASYTHLLCYSYVMLCHLFMGSSSLHPEDRSTHFMRPLPLCMKLYHSWMELPLIIGNYGAYSTVHKGTLRLPLLLQMTLALVGIVIQRSHFRRNA